MSRDHTERLLRRARAPFERDGSRVTVSTVDELELDEIVVPGDPSSAAFVVAAAMLVPRSRMVVHGASGSTGRAPGFLRIAQRMGAVIVGDLEEPGMEPDASRWASSTWPRGRSRRPSWSRARCRSRSTS